MPTVQRSEQPKLPPVDDMVMVAVIARLGSLTATANKLGINHATVFRRLIAMEQQWGQALFVRDGRVYTPTAVGRVLADSGEKILSIGELTLGKIQHNNSELSGVVKLTMPLDILMSKVGMVLEQFHHNYPDIVFDINTTGQVLNLSKRDADIAIRCTKTPPEHLIGKKIIDVNMAVYANPTLLKQISYKSMPLTLYALKQLPWLQLTAADMLIDMRQWIDNHIGRSRVRMQFNDMYTLQWAVNKGMGVAILPSIMANELVQVTDFIDGCQTELWLLMHPDFRHTPRIRVIYDALVLGLKTHFSTSN